MSIIIVIVIIIIVVVDVVVIMIIIILIVYIMVSSCATFWIVANTVKCEKGYRNQYWKWQLIHIFPFLLATHIHSHAHAHAEREAYFGTGKCLLVIRQKIHPNSGTIYTFDKNQSNYPGKISVLHKVSHRYFEKPFR